MWEDFGEMFFDSIIWKTWGSWILSVHLMFMYYMCLTEFAESERNWMNGILDPTNEIASRGA